ncbi:hypothetical protein [Xanthomonas campestris]|uniref:hypothetical protein n=1 Tax=Xanthomonas campestris TaxID=339 RepID=UPI002B2330AA|nr:hypothetical protein [Xanthomonas campestris]MEA9473547.1 hypothetical protein [Xanthomonas campestris]MEB1860471.1 hypothetical protein [Xanthomonas campestris pv. campestris]
MAAIQIPDGDIGDWLSELKPYQRRTLQVFLANATPEEAAERWLGSTGSPNIVPFGGLTIASHSGIASKRNFESSYATTKHTSKKGNP